MSAEAEAILRTELTRQAMLTIVKNGLHTVALATHPDRLGLRQDFEVAKRARDLLLALCDDAGVLGFAVRQAARSEELAQSYQKRAETPDGRAATSRAHRGGTSRHHHGGEHSWLR
jgi:hypothetical protein